MGEIDGGKLPAVRLGRLTPEKSHPVIVFRTFDVTHNFIFKKYLLVVIIYFTMSVPRLHRKRP
jgi:hypothetical protein